MEYFTKKAHLLLIAQDDERGPIPRLETYSHKNDTLHVHAEDREGFEQEEGIDLDADELEFNQWDLFLVWLRGGEYLMPDPNCYVLAIDLKAKTITFQFQEIPKGLNACYPSVTQPAHVEIL